MKALLVRAVTLSVLIFVHCDSGTRPKGIGSSAPQFSIQDDERKVALKDFRGQVVVLNFWTSWCPPCIEEAPSLVVMQQRLRAKASTPRQFPGLFEQAALCLRLVNKQSTER